tara:strand:- start:147 stop:1739 length:1593 start_codon:yes stop_codon:yes gene_type:complete
MAGKIKTSTLNCTENNLVSYSVAGTPLTTTSFTKTFTVVAGHIFAKTPSIDLSGVSDRNSYSIVVNDTGSVAGGNLTVRSFVVTYTHPLKEVVGDVISFVAKAELDIANSIGKIYNYNLSSTHWIKSAGTSRILSIYGDEGDANNAAADLTLDFKRNNSSIRVGGAGTVTIPAGGVYQELLTFPSTAANKTFTITMTQRANNSFLTMSTPTVVTIQQYIPTVINVNAIESASDFLVTGDFITISEWPFTTNSGTKGFHWYVTSQSDAAPLKYVGTFDQDDFSGFPQNDGTLRLAGGTKLSFINLSAEIYPVQTGVTAGATTGTAITLTGINNSIVKGMRVTGSGITHTGTNSTLVTAASGTSVTLSKSSTIASGTTLTFHSAVHVTGNVVFNKFGTVAKTCSLDVANIIGINQAPTPTLTDPISISAEEASNYTAFTATATDPEGDTLTFKVTVMPQHGQFRYTDTQNNLQTVTCTGQTLTSNNTLHATNKNLSYRPGDGNSQNTSFQYTVEDPHHAAVSTTVAINISAG